MVEVEYLDVPKLFWGRSHYVPRSDTEVNSPVPDPYDVWLFTDPDARELYANQGRLRRLEQDIRFEIMRCAPWRLEELNYKVEIRRLLKEEAIWDKETYGYLSPHSTVYRAKRDGILRLSGGIYPFCAGDDITFQCRVLRNMGKCDPGPVLVANINPGEGVLLCGEFIRPIFELE